jgi:hypothetical protein
MGKSTIDGPFSIAMLNYLRVSMSVIYKCIIFKFGQRFEILRGLGMGLVSNI